MGVVLGLSTDLCDCLFVSLYLFNLNSVSDWTCTFILFRYNNFFLNAHTKIPPDNAEILEMLFSEIYILKILWGCSRPPSTPSISAPANDNTDAQKYKLKIWRYFFIVMLSLTLIAWTDLMITDERFGRGVINFNKTSMRIKWYPFLGAGVII